MANESPMTLAEVRALLYRHYGDNDPIDPNNLFRSGLNEVLERISKHSAYEGAVERVDVQDAGYITSHLLTLPYAYESVLALTLNDDPKRIMDRNYEFRLGNVQRRKRGCRNENGVKRNLAKTNNGNTAICKKNPMISRSAPERSNWKGNWRVFLNLWRFRVGRRPRWWPPVC